MVGMKISLGNGNTCRPRKDSINDDRPICEKYSQLFDLCQSWDLTIQDALDANLVVPIQITLRGKNLEHWLIIKENMLSLNISNASNSVRLVLKSKQDLFYKVCN
jgi:hypothetical protein